MIGKTIVAFLKSPMFPVKIELDGKRVEIPRNVIQLKGEVLKEKGAGLVLRVQAMGADDLSIVGDDVGVKEIFLPFAKVDFLLLR